MDHSPSDLEGLTDAMMRAMVLVRQTWQQNAPLTGLDEAHLEILAALGQGSRRITQLAVDLGSDLSTVSRRISRLVALELVVKQPLPGDRRVQLAALTPAGCAALGAVLERRRQMMHGVLGGWPVEDLTALRLLLERMNEQVSEHCLP